MTAPSVYYRYKFISPQSLYAEVTEEFDSYFESGVLDDLMFPTWTSRALRKLKRASYDIKETVLHIDGFQAKLPDNFYGTREAWLCSPGKETLYTHPSSEYANCITSAILVDNPDGNTHCPQCGECDYPGMVQTVYKFTHSEVIRNYGRLYLLKPGNINNSNGCDLPCLNVGQRSPETFDIHGNKFVVNFREGIVHLVYYITQEDSQGSPLIPENESIEEFIAAYLKFELCKKLFNKITDETSRQIQGKLQYYEREKDLAFVEARAETMRETVAKKQRAIRRVYNRNSPYEIR